MNKKNGLKVLNFPNNISKAEKQVEAILFAAEEPLDIESIQEKLKSRVNLTKILESLQYAPFLSVAKYKSLFKKSKITPSLIMPLCIKAIETAQKGIFLK